MSQTSLASQTSGEVRALLMHFSEVPAMVSSVCFKITAAVLEHGNLIKYKQVVYTFHRMTKKCVV